MVDFAERSLIIHEQLRGKIAIVGKFNIQDKEDLSIAYTPGVAAPCQKIAEDAEMAKRLTIKGNSVAVVSDGSAVLGLGDIGPLASLPVMEGKALLLKKYGGVDAWPLPIDVRDPKEVIETVRRIAPCFGGINLEDISAPRCFEIEDGLQDLGIPVFHDDQHGTAIVVLAALKNALKITGKKMSDLRVVVNGAGAAGRAITRLLLGKDLDRDEEEEHQPVKDIIICDSKGIISSNRDNITGYKKEFLEYTNKDNISGQLRDALPDADVFVGVSRGDLLTRKEIRTMAKDSIIFALSNPIPEIYPEEALAGGARIAATGRSDFPNQVNNVLAFPGIFRGALNIGAPRITAKMKLAAANALAESVKRLSEERILPSPLDYTIAPIVAKAVSRAADANALM